MIGSIADINIQIGSGIYRLRDLYGKTIYAGKDLPTFKSYLSSKATGIIKRGEPVGIVQGYVANGYNGAKQPFLIIGPTSKQTFVVPYASSNFSESALLQQGTKTAREVVQSEKDEAQPWYLKLTNNLMPWILLGVGGYLLLKKKL